MNALAFDQHKHAGYAVASLFLVMSAEEDTPHHRKSRPESKLV